MELRNGCGCVIATYPDPVMYVHAAVGNPKEKIRIEPMESPVPSKTPAPSEPVEVPAKEPVT